MVDDLLHDRLDPRDVFQGNDGKWYINSGITTYGPYSTKQEAESAVEKKRRAAESDDDGLLP